MALICSLYCLAMRITSSFLLILPFIFHTISAQTDSINPNQSIRDGETLISSGGKFALGFFSPGNSKNRYVGIWFNNITETTVVWVANRENPLTDNSGVLTLIPPGILILVNITTNHTIWSSNATRPGQRSTRVTAQLLNSGNLVIRSENENYLWQSFDYPSDTYLPGMNLGWDLVNNREFYLTSWRSEDDPSPGEYSFHMDLTGYPQMLIKRGSGVMNRIGPWNGIRFPGPPNPREDPTYRLSFVMDEKRVYYRSDTVDLSFVSRYTMNHTGVSQRWTWVDRTRGWVIYFSLPADICDNYGFCGAFGTCDVGSSPSCQCLHRFVPRDPDGWVRADWSSGCVRRTNLTCNGDVFLRYSGIKLPDATNSWNNATMTLDECREECLRNCSCMAYTQLDIKKKSGCLIWFNELVDIRTLSPDGQVIYIRMAASEADEAEGKGKEKLIAILCTVTGVVLIIVALSLRIFIRKRKNDKTKMRKEEIAGKYSSSREKHSDLPFFDLSIILKATNHFSPGNKLGEGGFGPVYKGMLEEGQEIAVKRLSKDSMQGVDELKNELIFIAKLQHRNLVRLLGCCVQGEESMLVYEYMPNKSLDVFLFDQRKSMLLDWQMRFNIINGIARGLLYLHQDSRLRIIHRDLKASNILLDSDMNPKISDFGLARSFGGNQTEAQTRRVVGTYGYMSPEYAVDGLFSIKSDVFSFGVLVLEIVNGKRNRGFSHTDHSYNLLGHAWTLYKEGRWEEIADSSLENKQLNSSELLRSIQVGLLCVQQNPEERPTMSSVVLMLGNEGEIPQAKHPGFFTERDVLTSHNSTSTNITHSTNEITITMPEPR